MKPARHLPMVATLALCAAVVLVARVAGQAPTTPIDAFVRRQLHASDSDLQALVQGRAVVKTLTSTTRREMTTAGGVRVRGTTITRFVDQFKTLEGFRTSQFVLQIGKFSPEPHVGDLGPLTLEPEDIESLRTCRVGECGVQLSAADIRRFNKEVNWRSPTAARDAAALYKSILLGHLTEYRTGGLDRLIEYHAKDEPVRLATEIQSLFDARPSLLERTPALQDHVRRFPGGGLPNAQSFYYWSKEVFGFKPVIGVNHVCVYTDGERGEAVIVTTQIYASHYIDGSVAVSALVPDGPGAASGFYWLYVNRSRVGPLGGLLGTLSRPIIQRRARAGLAKSLVQTQQRLEARR